MSMQALCGERLVAAWERGQQVREPWRALALLEVASGAHVDALARMPLAERNARLLEVRVATFGREVNGFAVCSRCGAHLEFAVDAERLGIETGGHSGECGAQKGTEPAVIAELAEPARVLCEGKLIAHPAREWSAEAGGSGAGYGAAGTGGDGVREPAPRAVNSADLAAAMEASDGEEARAVLLERTLGVEVRALDAEERARCEAEFERVNAGAEMQCVLECAACGAREVSDFDIASFLWREVTQAARRLLAEVHRLALAYGWSEPAVLGMSEVRRNAYLSLLDQVSTA